MPFFSGAEGNCEALQLERVNLSGAPMFSAALPPWFHQATAKPRQAVGAIYWSKGETFLRCADGVVLVEVGDWIARYGNEEIAVYEASDFAEAFELIDSIDQED